MGVPGPRRACPVCEHDRVLTVDAANRVFRTGDWGRQELLDHADLVCSFCHSARVDGSWTRLDSVAQRSWELGEASDSKSAGEYRSLLTSGKSV